MVLQPNLLSGCDLSVYQISRQLDSVFITTFTPWWNEDKKKETKPIFEGSYLGNAQWDLVEIWNVRLTLAGILTTKMFCFIKVSRSYVYVKIEFLFFLLITHGYGMPASCITHYCVSWLNAATAWQ